MDRAMVHKILNKNLLSPIRTPKVGHECVLQRGNDLKPNPRPQRGVKEEVRPVVNLENLELLYK